MAMSLEARIAVLENQIAVYEGVLYDALKNGDIKFKFI
jgi:uncharacterized coiled-coil protein SlyX